MEQIQLILLPAALAFIMFSLGITLVADDFYRVVRRPLSFLTGAFNQLLLIPVVTFWLILAFDVTGELAVGMMILSACPGGVTSNLYSKLAKGDLALSVTLTAVISIVSVVTLPFITSVSLSYFLGHNAVVLEVGSTILRLFLLSAAPVLLGVTMRAFFPEFFARIETTVFRIALFLYAVILVFAITAGWSVVVANIQTLGAILVTLVVVLMTVGYVVARLLRRSIEEAKTISIETGLQNNVLGITVAGIVTAQTGGDFVNGFTVPSGVYGLFMLIVALLAIPIFWSMKSPAGVRSGALGRPL